MSPQEPASKPIPLDPAVMAQLRGALHDAFRRPGPTFRARQYGNQKPPACPRCRQRPSVVMDQTELHAPPVVTFKPCGHTFTVSLERSAPASRPGSVVLKPGERLIPLRRP